MTTQTDIVDLVSIIDQDMATSMIQGGCDLLRIAIINNDAPEQLLLRVQDINDEAELAASEIASLRQREAELAEALKDAIAEIDFYHAKGEVSLLSTRLYDRINRALLSKQQGNTDGK